MRARCWNRRNIGRMPTDARATIDPDIRRLLDTIFSVPPSGLPDVAQLRAATEIAPKILGGPPEPVASVRDMVVPGGESGVPVRIYRPGFAGAVPLALFAHGGGWVTGSLESHDRLCRILANAFRCVVVAVDYALAPEHVYPAALNDVECAWRWVRDKSHDLGADGARFIVAGDSSGGNLAAALTLRLARRGAPQPDLQVLLYPALDALCARDSYRAFATGYNLTASQMAWYWDAYRAGAEIHPELCPLSAPQLGTLPPAVVAVATADVLRDDGLDYAKRLETAGVPVRVIECNGMIHGFLRWTGEVVAARRWIELIAEAVRETTAAVQ
jgi:acetyl esterase